MFVLTDGYGLTSAMLLGVIATYYLEPKGDPTYIFTGVAILFVAVIMNTIASTYAHRYVS